MTDYLKKVSRAEHEIRMLNHLIERCRADRKEAIELHSFLSDWGSTDGSEGKGLVQLFDDEIAGYQKEIEEQKTLLANAQAVLDSMPKQAWADLVKHSDIEHMTLKDTALLMSYSHDWARKYHTRAKKTFNDLYTEMFAESESVPESCSSQTTESLMVIPHRQYREICVHVS